MNTWTSITYNWTPSRNIHRKVLRKRKWRHMAIKEHSTWKIRASKNRTCVWKDWRWMYLGRGWCDADEEDEFGHAEAQDHVLVDGVSLALDRSTRRNEISWFICNYFLSTRLAYYSLINSFCLPSAAAKKTTCYKQEWAQHVFVVVVVVVVSICYACLISATSIRLWFRSQSTIFEKKTSNDIIDVIFRWLIQITTSVMINNIAWNRMRRYTLLLRPYVN